MYNTNLNFKPSQPAGVEFSFNKDNKTIFLKMLKSLNCRQCSLNFTPSDLLIFTHSENPSTPSTQAYFLIQKHFFKKFTPRYLNNSTLNLVDPQNLSIYVKTILGSVDKCSDILIKFKNNVQRSHLTESTEIDKISFEYQTSIGFCSLEIPVTLTPRNLQSEKFAREKLQRSSADMNGIWPLFKYDRHYDALAKKDPFGQFRNEVFILFKKDRIEVSEMDFMNSTQADQQKIVVDVNRFSSYHQRNLATITGGHKYLLLG
jgi:hypothetical protein